MRYAYRYGTIFSIFSTAHTHTGLHVIILFVNHVKCHIIQIKLLFHQKYIWCSLVGAYSIYHGPVGLGNFFSFPKFFFFFFLFSELYFPQAIYCGPIDSRYSLHHILFANQICSNLEFVALPYAKRKFGMKNSY